ncbi:polymerase protein, partial [Lake trout rhabdovirus 903/87]
MSYDDTWEDPHWGDSTDDADIPEWLSDDIVRGNPLNQKDYSLNSPLISDATIALMNYLNDGLTEKRFERSNANFALIQKTLKTQRWKHPEVHNHKWMGLWINKEETCKAFANLIDQTNADVLETEGILQAFLKGWIDQTTSAPTKTGWTARQRSYGAKFFLLHRMILLMNAQSEEERDLLQKSLHLTRAIEKELIYRGESTTLGKYTLTSDFLLLQDQEIILDRTFVLMLKDTLVGRMQTLACFMNREDKKYEDGIIEKMEKLYWIGDKMLADIGDDAYAGIKLLEPICNLRLAEMARTFRPLVPEFPHFRQHVETAVQEESQENFHLSDFYDFVNAEQNVETLLAFFGSFRHWGHPYIDYFEGLKKLNKQVTLPKEIDETYAEALASDLAYMILRKHFNTKRIWAVAKERVANDHPLKDHIKNATWPTPKQIDDFGDNWHKLPLTKIFEIPDLID